MSTGAFSVQQQGASAQQPSAAAQQDGAAAQQPSAAAQQTGAAAQQDGAAAPQKRPLSKTIAAYVALTKPRVMELLLVVTVPAMILAQNGLPNLWLVLATLIGGAMSAGSAGAFDRLQRLAYE